MALCLLISLMLLFGPLDAQWVSFVGYAITPFGSIALLAWASSMDSKLRLDVWYDRHMSDLILVRALGALGFLVGLAHMWTVATYIARIAAGGLS
jgi:hypothetical protein